MSRPEVEKAYVGILEALRQISPLERAAAAEAVLEKHEEFFFAPASSKKGLHGSFPGGLAVHTFCVLKTAFKLASALGYKNISGVIVGAVFHDLGKILSYRPAEGGGYKKNRCTLPHSAQSLKLLHDCGFALTQDEYQAILMHNGLYTPMGQESANRETRLTYIIHWADVWCALALKT